MAKDISRCFKNINRSVSDFYFFLLFLMGKPFVYFINGVSGVGKTTVVETMIQTNPSQKTVLLKFDDIGIPSYEEMVEQYGSGEARQKAAVEQRIDIITTKYHDADTVILEWQSNGAFIKQAFETKQHTAYEIMLLICDDAEITRRLTQRGQPDLANPDMFNRQKYLKQQAQEGGWKMIDTTNLDTDEVKRIVLQQINKKVIV